jgi:hypothetical protein
MLAKLLPPSPAHADPAISNENAHDAPARREILDKLTNFCIADLHFRMTRRAVFGTVISRNLATFGQMQQLVLVNGDRPNILLHLLLI